MLICLTMTTYLEREFESLKEIVEAKMETMEAKNKTFLVENVAAIDRLRLDYEKAIDRLRLDYEKAIGGLRSDHEKAIGELRTDYERLRTDIGRGVNKLIMVLIAIGGVSVAVVSLLN